MTHDPTRDGATVATLAARAERHLTEAERHLAAVATMARLGLTDDADDCGGCDNGEHCGACPCCAADLLTRDPHEFRDDGWPDSMLWPDGDGGTMRHGDLREEADHGA